MLKRSVKNQILEMTVTLNNAITYVYENNYTSSVSYDELSGFLEAINQAVAEYEQIDNLGKEIQKNLQQIKENHTKNNKLLEITQQYIDLIEHIPVKIKVLFLPYYESTWDALESIYQAYKVDDKYEVQVTIVPVYLEQKTVYTDWLTPRGIENTDYVLYDIEQDKPDLVFTNNPYELQTHKKFQTENMKKYVKKIVFVPYWMYVHHQYTEVGHKHVVSRYTELEFHNNVDHIIGCGETYKKILGTPSKNSHKIEILGSPKADYIVNNKETYPKYKNWDDIFKGKKVFLLNTHFTSFGDRAYLVEDMYKIIKYLVNLASRNPKVAILWRPHPNTFLYSVAWKPEVRVLLEGIQKGDYKNVVLDDTGDYLSALYYCDAVISEWSSLITAAALLDKPIYSLSISPISEMQDKQKYYEPQYQQIIDKAEEKITGEITTHVAFHHAGLVRPLKEGEDLFQNMYLRPLTLFIEEILADKDTKKEIRSQYINEHIKNKNGTVGQEIKLFIEEKIKKDFDILC